MAQQSTKSAYRAQYRRIHIRIIKGILKLMRQFKVRITTRQLSEETGLPPRTIHNHGGDLNKILDDEEAALLGQFFDIIEKASIRETGRITARAVNKGYFQSLLFFMAKNKQEFVPICEDQNNWELLRKMVATIYDRLEITWFPVNDPVPSSDSEIGQRFIAMAVQVIGRWGWETGCDIEKTGLYLRELLVLTEEMRNKCRL